MSAIGKEAATWMTTAVVLLAAGVVLAWYAIELSVPDGMEGVRFRLIVPSAVLLLAGGLLVGSSIAMSKSKKCALAVLRVVSYLMLLSFVIGCAFILTVWVRRWLDSSFVIAIDDVVAIMTIAATFWVGVRGWQAARRMK